MALSGGHSSGTINSFTGRLEAGVQRDWERDRVRLNLDAMYGKSDGDIDTNYQALKVEAGVKTELFALSMFWGNYRLMQGPMGGGALTSIDNRLGNEIDFRLKLFPMDNVEIGLSAAFLFQSERGMVLTVFNWVVLWAHYFGTERSDMKIIYGRA